MLSVADERRVHRDAARIIRSRARSFYLASLFLPEAARRDVRIAYAYYRTVDDLVDEPPAGWRRDDIRKALARWGDAIRGRGPAPNPTLGETLLAVADRHAIPTEGLCMVLEGAQFDLDLRRIETREQLLWYSMRVAGSVGVVMAHILGARGEDALAAAASLGVAMQLTNVLRDVGEDLDRGRIYLPRTDLDRHRCSLDLLTARVVSPELCAVITDLTEEARRHYRHGMDGIHHLDPSARFAIHLAAILYSRILDKIAGNGFDVFGRRAHLGTLEKWMLALPVYLQHRQMLAQR